MLDSKSYNHESEPISIAADGDVVDHWIDFLKNDPVVDLRLAHIESLLKLCETFKMDTLAAAIYPQLLRYVRSASTEVFCIAAKFDNQHLARIAAMEMFRAYYAQSEVLCRDKVTSLFKSEPMASCPRNYVLELHLAAFFCGFTQTKSGLWGIDREEWTRQIDNFDPQVSVGASRCTDEHCCREEMGQQSTKADDEDLRDQK